MNRMKIVAAIFLGLLLAAGSSAQERYVRPVDEAADDASFLKFRTQLIAAAKKRDVRFILSILDPKIELSYGGHQGIEDFKELWKIHEPGSKFWDEFLRVINNGGKFISPGPGEGKVFAAPYTFTQFPADLDEFEYFAIFGSNVNLRERPSMDARAVSRLSYNIVKVDTENSIKRPTGTEDWDFEYDWFKVETLGGLKGFVKAEYVRGPIDYRAGFEKKRGAWKMTYFIAGD